MTREAECRPRASQDGIPNGSATKPHSSVTSVAQAAASAAERGWHVFPVVPGGKEPAIPDWPNQASADPALAARAFAERYPHHNYGISCGPSGLVVIDLDTHGSIPAEWAQPGIVDGKDVFTLLLEWAGETSWPDTYWVRTPSDGWHLYYTAPAGVAIGSSSGLLGPMIDVQASGRQVVGAGSVVGGQVYEVLDDTEPAPLPAWIIRALAPPKTPARQNSKTKFTGSSPRRLEALADVVRGGQPGDRNSPLYWAACRVAEAAAAGEMDPAEATEVLVAAALDAGLRGGEREARATIASGLRGAR